MGAGTALIVRQLRHYPVSSIIYVLNIIYFNDQYNFLNVKINSTDENNHLYNVLITVQNIPPFQKKLLTTGSYVYCAMYTCDVILLLKVGHLHTFTHIWIWSGHSSS